MTTFKTTLAQKALAETTLVQQVILLIIFRARHAVMCPYFHQVEIVPVVIFSGVTVRTQIPTVAAMVAALVRHMATAGAQKT